ncbi:MAG TPA: medium chain dehydrogenase/reductase family protein [Nocardioidaceae bacterium]|jgi:NADPH:quinone reductase-like Zn-dependent oxidoreductase|nr:medium chain dehydrogenase/reductase family protein [Nocardioidaceae bacterium]
MKRVIVDHYGGPEVLRVVDEDDPRPGPGEVGVRVLAAGVSFTDALIRAGTYLGGPKPPFTPGYELVGIVEELGPGCVRLKEGDRVGALTVWGADAERVCVPEKYAVEVPDDLDPAEVVSLIFPYMTAYQMLHRTARVRRGETVLVHGAAGRVGTAALELGAVAGLRLFGTCSAGDKAAVERLGAVAIDYQNEDFLARVRELTGGEGVDVVLDGIGGQVALRSFRGLRLGDPVKGDPGGRLITMGNYNTMSKGHKSWRGWLQWWPATVLTVLWGTLSPRREVMGYRVQKLRVGHQDWFAEDFSALLELLREHKIHPIVAERLPLSDARRAHELLDSSASKGKLVLVP